MPELMNGKVATVVAPTLVPVITAAPSAVLGVVVVPVPGPRGPRGVNGDDPEALGEVIATAVDTHVNSPTPHPVYDDLPSLTLLFENRLA